MALGLLGKKIRMTQIFDKKGNVIPVTVIKVGPCFITQIKTKENSGYTAIQLGFSEVSESKNYLNKPQLGHFIKKNILPFKYLKEYRLEENSEVGLKVMLKLTVNIFHLGQKVDITGLTSGKGNAGNIKKNNFSRGPMAHGSKHHRLQGSLGAGTTPGRVFPGKKMPGRLGMQQRTLIGLQILDIDSYNNLLIVKGSLPGKTGNLLSVNFSKKDVFVQEQKI